MKLVVGLGNPGKQYENTRHNIGFIIVDNIVGNVKWKSTKQYEMYEDTIQNNKVLFIKPNTYMNLSGEAVVKVAEYYKIKPEDILVIRDDLDLSQGKHKIKYNSSSGGHNGIKNIIKLLNTQEFTQLKVGISNPNINTIDYVLGKLSKQEIRDLSNLKYKAIVESFIVDGYEKTISKYN